MNIFIFDIETIPDVTSGRKLYDLQGLNDEDTAEALFALRREQAGTDFLRLHLQQIVAISVVLHTHETLKVWSLGDTHSPESELLERFYAGIDRYTPTIVSWNGSGFDLPVIHYRSLLHGISAPRYWETGENEQGFRWNNYLNRYHERHLDLMDVVAGYQPRANAPLDEIATMLGFPGKMGMSGKHVWSAYKKGEQQSIRHYCETDVLNTYLVYLRFEFMRGHLSQTQYKAECTRLRELLAESSEHHLQEFLANWRIQ